MKKFSKRILIITVLSISFLSCSENMDSEEYSSLNDSDLTITEAQKFVSEYSKTDLKGKENLLSDFSKKTNKSINDSQALNTVVLNNYTGAELSQTIPQYGPVQLTLPYEIGDLRRIEVTWYVKQQIAGLWWVRSYEDVAYDQNTIRQVIHINARLQGLTLELVNWQESNGGGSNTYVSGNGRNFVSRVQGDIHIVGYGYMPVDEYCIYSLI